MTLWKTKQMLPFLSSDLFGQSENIKTRQKEKSQNYCKKNEKKNEITTQQD